MRKNVIEIIEKILEDHTGYAIAKKIGVRPQQINRLQARERPIKNITLDLTLKILEAYTTITIT